METLPNLNMFGTLGPIFVAEKDEGDGGEGGGGTGSSLDPLMVVHDLSYSFWHLVHSRTHSFVKIIRES